MPCTASVANIFQSKVTAIRADCWVCVLVIAGCLVSACTQSILAEAHTSVTPKANSGQCGSWQDDYIQLHKDILSGRKPPRYAISVPAPAGLSDRLVGAVSVFYYALLTDRAFQIAGDLMTHVEAYLHTYLWHVVARYTI